MDFIIESLSFVIVTLFLSTVLAVFGGAIGNVMYKNSKQKDDKDFYIAFYTGLVGALLFLLFA